MDKESGNRTSSELEGPRSGSSVLSELQLLNQSATQLLSLTAEDEIYSYTGHRLSTFLEKSIIVINKNGPDEKMMQIQGIYGLQKTTLGKGFKMLGYSPVNRTYRMHPEVEPLFRTGKLELFEGGLPHLAKGYVPALVSQQIEKLLKLNQIYFIGLQRSNRLYAGIQIYTRQEAVIDNPDLIETFIQQVSIALHRVKAEAARRESEARYRRLVETSPDSIVLTDLEGNILLCNQQTAALHGVAQPEQMIGRNAFEFIAEKEHTRARTNLEKTLGSIEIQAVEYQMIKKDGSPFYGELHASLIRDTAGQPQAFIGITRDITDRKRIEHALRASEERYRLLVESAQDPIFLIDEEGLFLAANKAAAQHLGRRPGTLAGKTMRMLFPQAVAEAQMQVIRQVIETRQGRFIGPVSTTIQGETRFYSMSLQPIIDQEGHCCSVQGIAHDMTAHKQAEEALQQTLDRLEGIKKYTPDLMTVMDEQGRYLMANRAAAELLARKPRDIVGKTCAELLPPDVADRFMARLKKVLGTGHPLEVEDEFYQAGAKHIFTTTLFPLFDAQNRCYAVGGIAKNVTRRRESEQALQESEARLRQIIRQMPYPVEVCNPDGTVSIVNQAFLDMFGLASADLLVSRYNVFDDPIIMQHPGLKEAIAQVYSGQPVYIPELTLPPELYGRYGLQKKEPAVYELSMFPVLARSQEIWQVVTIWIDINDRKQAENALHRSARRLQILYDIDQAILAAQTPEAIALAALNHLRRLLPYTRASVVEIKPAEGAGRTLATVGQQGEQISFSPDDPLEGHQALIDVLAQGRPHVVQNITAVANPSPVEQFLLKIGIRGGYLTTPLLIQGELVGMLNIVTANPHAFTPEDVEITQEVANPLAIALNQARLYSQTQQDARIKADLLREVNHRVSNNLSGILGLLAVETRHARQRDQPAVEETLSRLTDRIKGLVTVHHLLSQAQWQPVLLSELAEQIIQAVLSILPSDRRIKLEIGDSPVVVSPRQAGNLALILNELATNTIKHGRQKRGRIEIQIETAEDWIALTYQDNGPGYSQAVLSGGEHNVGLYLLKQLAGALSGQVHLDNDGGAVTRLRFPVDQKQRKL